MNVTQCNPTFESDLGVKATAKQTQQMKDYLDFLMHRRKNMFVISSLVYSLSVKTKAPLTSEKQSYDLLSLFVLGA